MTYAAAPCFQNIHSLTCLAPSWHFSGRQFNTFTMRPQQKSPLGNCRTPSAIKSNALTRTTHIRASATNPSQNSFAAMPFTFEARRRDGAHDVAVATSESASSVGSLEIGPRIEQVRCNHSCALQTYVASPDSTYMTRIPVVCSQASRFLELIPGRLFNRSHIAGPKWCLSQNIRLTIVLSTWT